MNVIECRHGDKMDESENSAIIFIIGLFIAILAGVAGGKAALRKGRSQKGWTLLCFFLPPSIFIIELLSNQNKKYLNGKTHFELSPCEACGRSISSDARRCPGCGHRNKGFVGRNISFLELATCAIVGVIVSASLLSATLDKSLQNIQNIYKGNGAATVNKSLDNNGSNNVLGQIESIGQPITDADYIANKALIHTEEENWSACVVQDPDNVKDMAPCNNANRALRKLSAKGICLGTDKAESWVRCRNGSDTKKIYPGRGVNFINTDGGGSYQSEKIPDVAGEISKICPSGIKESEPVNFTLANDPYAFKSKCYAMQVSAIAHIQWLSESSVLFLPIIPGTKGVVLTSPGHLELGRQGVFIGDNPTQYQSAGGAMETVPTFRLIMYAR